MRALEKDPGTAFPEPFRHADGVRQRDGQLEAADDRHAGEGRRPDGRRCAAEANPPAPAAAPVRSRSRLRRIAADAPRTVVRPPRSRSAQRDSRTAFAAGHDAAGCGAEAEERSRVSTAAAPPVERPPAPPPKAACADVGRHSDRDVADSSGRRGERPRSQRRRPRCAHRRQEVAADRRWGHRCRDRRGRGGDSLVQPAAADADRGGTAPHRSGDGRVPQRVPQPESRGRREGVSGAARGHQADDGAGVHELPGLRSHVRRHAGGARSRPIRTAPRWTSAAPTNCTPNVRRAADRAPPATMCFL